MPNYDLRIGVQSQSYHSEVGHHSVDAFSVDNFFVLLPNVETFGKSLNEKCGFIIVD